MSLKLYVGNLAPSATEASLQNLFASFGEVKSARVAIDRETGRPKGCGFVRMASDQAGEDAIIGLNGRDVDGQQLRVKVARSRADKQRRNGYSGT